MPSKSDLEAMTAIVTGRELVDADKLALYVDPKELAAALGGKLYNANTIRCPGPGHSAGDQSLSILISPDAEDGFTVHSFADDDWRECRDIVMEAIRGLPKGERRTFAAQPVPEKPENRASFRKAKPYWDGSIPITGTVGEIYLREARGITLPLEPTDLRFHGRVWGWPAMLAAIRDVDGQVTGFQVIRLRDDGRWKAGVPDPRTTHGALKGGAVRLAPAGPALMITEGIESALTTMLCDPQHRPAWAAISAGNLACLKLPPVVRSVTIYPDGDHPTKAHPAGHSQEAANEAALRWQQEGRQVDIWRAVVRPGFKGTDLNDLLMERLGLRRPLTVIEGGK